MWDSIHSETSEWNIYNIFEPAVHSSVQFKAASSQHQHPSPRGLKDRPVKLLLLRTHRDLLSETLLDGHVREKATELLDDCESRPASRRTRPTALAEDKTAVTSSERQCLPSVCLKNNNENSYRDSSTKNKHSVIIYSNFLKESITFSAKIHSIYQKWV